MTNTFRLSICVTVFSLMAFSVNADDWWIPYLAHNPARLSENKDKVTIPKGFKHQPPNSKQIINWIIHQMGAWPLC